MSLQYIIDGCNVINHPLFRRRHKKGKDSRLELPGFISLNNLCGSLRNSCKIVFDGFPPSKDTSLKPKAASIIFSAEDSADDLIKKLLDESPNPKNIKVVSDDKQVRLCARFSGACAVSVEEFINRGNDLKSAKKAYLSSLEPKPELKSSEVFKINQELERLWLK